MKAIQALCGSDCARLVAGMINMMRRIIFLSIFIFAVLPAGDAAEPLPSAAGPLLFDIIGETEGPGGARAAVELLQPDQLLLRTWAQRRDPEPASRQTVTLRPQQMPWLRIDRFAIRIGESIGRSGRSVGNDLAAAGKGWSWGWQRARDLRLRLCWRDAAAGNAAVLAGGVASADTLVFELCLRHGVGGGDDITVHGNDFTAIYQVPEGVEASVARKDAANRLGVPTFLKAVRPGPELRVAFLVGSEGQWRLLLDRDGDGEADVSFGDGDEGCQVSSFRFATPQPVIEVISATPERPEQVTTTKLQCSLAPGPTWVEEPRRAPRLAWVGEAPTASLVSPAPLRLEIEPGAVPSAVDGAGAALVCDLTGERHATATLPLDPERPVTALITASGSPPAQRSTQVTWTPTVVSAGDPIRVLRGTSLLLDAPGAEAIVVGEARLPPGGPYRFDSLGELVLRAVGGDNAERMVRVSATDLPDPLPVPRRGRALEVACDRPAAEIRWSIEDGPTQLAVLRSSGTRCRLAIKPGKADTFMLVARDAAGEVLQGVRGVLVDVVLDRPELPARIIDPAATPGVDAQQFSIRLIPWVPGVRVRSVAIDSRCHFNRDLGEIEVVCGGGEASSGEAPMRRLEGVNGPIGAFDYALLMPTWDGSWAHRNGIVFPGDEPLPKKMPRATVMTLAPPAPVETPKQGDGVTGF